MKVHRTPEVRRSAITIQSLIRDSFHRDGERIALSTVALRKTRLSLENTSCEAPCESPSK